MSTVAATDPIAPEEEEKARSKRADFLIARHPRIESVDIGGTKIAVGAVREDAILDRLECRTNSEQGRQNAKHTGEDPMKLPRWLMLSFAVPVLWGLWGALTEIPEKWLTPPIPPTLGYVIWSLAMILVSVIALRKINWKVTLKGSSIIYGCAVGFSGAAGQLILFWVLKEGPAYLIFPIVCLSPAVTIALSWTLLRERAYPLSLAGIILSLPAILLVSLQPSTHSPVHGFMWLAWAILVFFMWGLQAYFIKSSANTISAEELFVYIALTGLTLSPIALMLGPWPSSCTAAELGITFAIQSLNAAGCLLFVYAVRYGKAIVVVPMVNGAFPLVTIAVSLMLYREIPSSYNLAGMGLALAAVLLMAFDEVRHNPA